MMNSRRKLRTKNKSKFWIQFIGNQFGAQSGEVLVERFKFSIAHIPEFVRQNLTIIKFGRKSVWGKSHTSISIWADQSEFITNSGAISLVIQLLDLLNIHLAIRSLTYPTLQSYYCWNGFRTINKVPDKKIKNIEV